MFLVEKEADVDTLAPELQRRATRQIQVRTIPIGRDAPIAVQSIATTYMHDVQATVAQIHRLEEVCCELVRVACPKDGDIQAWEAIKRQIHLPL
jgi:(E)-4-hydroxy-3-methylbut-2-enyl-diphosphate synthase